MHYGKNLVMCTREWYQQSFTFINYNDIITRHQCAAALSMTGIKRVFFGCKNDRFGGCGSLLNLHMSNALPSSKHHGFAIHGGILEEEAIRLLRSFYERENFHAPAPVRRRKIGRIS